MKHPSENTSMSLNTLMTLVAIKHAQTSGKCLVRHRFSHYGSLFEAYNELSSLEIDEQMEIGGGSIGVRTERNYSPSENEDLFDFIWLVSRSSNLLYYFVQIK